MSIPSIMTDFLRETWWLTAEMSPYLLIGFLFAGMLRIFFTEKWVREHLGKKGIRQVIKAVLIGIPLPLCSCGVIPVAAGIRRQGGQKGAVAAFTASTPQTGIDSIAATVGMLGWVFMLARVCIAFVNGIVAGLVVEFLERGKAAEDQVAEKEEGCGCGCSDKLEGPAPTGPLAPSGPLTPAGPIGNPMSFNAPASDQIGSSISFVDDTEVVPSSCCSEESTKKEASSCCSSDNEDKGSELLPRLSSGMRFGLLTLPRDLFWSLVIGLLIAGAIGSLAPEEFFTELPGGRFGLYIAMTLISLPLYVCSTGSIPMAFTFLHAGMSPGAVLIFLIAGPASNSATVTSLIKIIGTRGTIGYIVSIIGTCWLAAIVLDYSGISLLVGEALHHHETSIGWFPQLTGALLIGLLLGSKIPFKRSK
ncbi:MAG: SO_0444 family Cu/Zn efflux transporter [Puniceicoccaceae bacterium]